MLIKAVIQAIPTYMMSIFKIPDGLLEEIHAMMSHFWWGSSGDAKKIHWHSWADLCRPKSIGGMGFRDLKCFNQALLAKQMWRLHYNANPLLSAVFKARYYKHTDSLDANRGYNPSLPWRSIWSAKSLLIEGLGWRVGRGDRIHIQSELWLMADGKFVTPRLIVDNTESGLVWHYINQESRAWKIESLQGIFDGTTIDHILAIPLPPNAVDDRLIWMFSKDGNYNVRSGYWVGMGSPPGSTLTPQIDEIWKKIWKLQWPPKLKHFFWRACKNSLPVNAVRHHRHMAPNPDCSRCDGGAETVFHAL